MWISTGGSGPRPPKPPREKPGPVAWTFGVIGGLLLVGAFGLFIWSVAGDIVGHDVIGLSIAFGVPAIVLVLVLPWRRIARRVFVKD